MANPFRCFDAKDITNTNRGVDNGELAPDTDPARLASYFFTVYSGLNVVGKINDDKKALTDSVETSLLVLV